METKETKQKKNLFDRLKTSLIMLITDEKLNCVLSKLDHISKILVIKKWFGCFSPYGLS